MKGRVLITTPQEWEGSYTYMDTTQNAFIYSNGKRFACDQWKGPPTTNKPIFHVRRCFQFIKKKTLEWSMRQ